MQNIREKDLLLLIKQSDHVAYKQAFDIYVEKVYHYIYGYIRNKQQSEDLAQDVFKKLWEKRSHIDENKSLSGFLFTLCYHQVVDHFRAGKTSIPVFSTDYNTEL